MAEIKRTYFEQAKKDIIDANNAIEEYKNKFSEIKEVEDELAIAQENFGRIERRRLEYLNKKLRDNLNLSKSENDERENLLKLEEKIKSLTEEKKNNQIALNKAYAQQTKELKEGYWWIDKAQERLSENGGRAFLRGLNDIKKGGIEIYNTVKKFIDPWGKANQAASNYAKAIGMSQKGMRQLTNNSIDFVHSQAISAKYNKSIDELIKLQQNYSSKVGRSISMTDKQKESIAAMSSVMGDDMATDIAAKLENFGLSAVEAGDRVGKMFSNASKKGLSFEAVSKNFLENIKIAQNYTFKNGLKGLASMAEKATAIKLNMSQASSFADKVSTVEGAIKTGAQLQVLGGPFAQFSNPLNMLYESLNDMEGLQDRIVSMFGNLGTFNRETGEMNVSSFNRMRIRQAAQATGMDYSNLMEMINAKGKRNAMGDLSKYGFSEEIQELLYNKATFNNKTKEWGVSGRNGEFISLNGLKGNNSELQYLTEISKSETEDIKDIAQILRGWNDSISGLGKQYQAAQAKATKDLNLGEFLLTNVQSISENVSLLKTLAYVNAGANIAGAAFNIVKGVPRIFKGIRGLFGLPSIGKGTGGVNSPDVIGRLDDYRRNSIGRLINKSTGRYTSKDILDDVIEQRRMDLATNGGKLSRRGSEKVLSRFSTKIGGRSGLKLYKELSKLGKFGKIGGISAGLFDMVNTGINEFSDNSNHSTVKKIGRTAGSGLGGWGGAAAGAAIGASLGPVGALIGGIIGGLGGSELGKWIGGGFASDRRRNNKKEELNLTELKGDYSVAQLKRIKEYISTGNEGILKRKDIKKLKENNELDVLSQKIQTANMNAGNVIINTTNPSFTQSNIVPEIKMAKGGILNGPSHANGGIKILGSNMSVEGGEFIVNKESTKKYINELKNINSDISPIKPIEPIGKILKVSNNETKNSKINDINIKPIDININGTIKLDTGNQVVDITKTIINNPVFIRNLTDIITKQMNTNINSSFNKDNFKQKWTTLY